MMIILGAAGVSMGFDGDDLFNSISFDIQEGQKIGLIGTNGCGKTTLFNLITGRLSPDEGGFTRIKGLKIGYMQQIVSSSSEQTAYDAVLEVFSEVMAVESELNGLTATLESDHSDDAIARHAELQRRFEMLDGLTYRARARSSLLGLGFTEQQIALPLSSLSGGQLSKLSLARLLLSGAELLLLDEPTNHLDIQSVEWLENYLRSYRGAALIISHDRYFLDAVTTRTFEIEHRRLTAYDGNYTVYMQKKAAAREAERRHYENTMKEVGRIEGIIAQQRQWNREKNIKTAEAKQKEIDRLTKDLVKPDSDDKRLRFAFTAAEVSGNDVLTAVGLEKGYGEHLLYSGVDLTVHRGERIFLLGDNGCGKTTLLRQLLACGRGIRLGAGVKIGYFDQTQQTLCDANTALDEVWNAYPAKTETDIRSALAAFLFTGDAVYKKIGEMSGGERARVALLKLMLSRSNLLLLDEPTNHLDVFSRQALEDALNDYGGTLLIVSHDRRFIDRLATKIWHMQDGGVQQYDGNYTFFAEHRQSAAAVEPQPVRKMGAGGRDYQNRKEQQARLRRARSRVAAIEQQSGDIDLRINELNQQLSSPETATDYQAVARLSEQIDLLNRQQAQLTDEWERLMSELEQLETT